MYVSGFITQTKPKTKIIRTQSNFTFPRKWSWTVQNIKQGPTEYHTEGTAGFHLEPIGNMAKKKKTHTELEMKNYQG